MQANLLAAFEKEFPHLPSWGPTWLLPHAGPTRRAKRGRLWRWPRQERFSMAVDGADSGIELRWDF